MYIKIHTEHGDLKKATPLKHGIFGSPLLNFRCVYTYIYIKCLVCTSLQHKNIITLFYTECFKKILPNQLPQISLLLDFFQPSKSRKSKLPQHDLA